jgi:cytochrome c-type biogenesis protein CcmH/NrfG
MASDTAKTPPTPPWAVQYDEAARLTAEGRSRGAVGPLERAVALNPGLGVAWRLLGDIRLISGDFAGAQNAYDRMLVAVLPDPRLKAPADALAAGHSEEAERALRAVLIADGSNLPAAHLMAEVRPGAASCRRPRRC